MAPQTRKRARVEAQQALAVQASTPRRRTITDLPVELLHMVFAELEALKEYFPRDYVRISPSTLVCKTLRNVAIEYLTFSHPNVTGTAELDHFMRFMQLRPTRAGSVTILRLFDTVLDAARVGAIKQLFPELQDMILTNITCIPPPCRGAGASRPAGGSTTEPLLRLRRMNFSCARTTSGWTLSGMMYILSLIEPRELHVAIGGGGYSKHAFDPRCVARRSAVEELVVRFDDPESKKCLASLLDALSHTLDPKALELVEVQYDSKDTLRALGTMLGRVGRNVDHITVYANAPAKAHKRETWIDPFDDYRLLDIRACERLAVLNLNIYVRPKENVSQALSLVGAGLVKNYASRATLRKVEVRLYDLPRPTTLGNRRVLRLQEFDKALTPARFPQFRAFVLHVGITCDVFDTPGYEDLCCEAAVRALPGLQSRDQLGIRVRTWFDE